jgi:hypothetical protein
MNQTVIDSSDAALYSSKRRAFAGLAFPACYWCGFLHLYLCIPYHVKHAREHLNLSRWDDLQEVDQRKAERRRLRATAAKVSAK